ncbi:MAG: hypothetical protein KAT34_13425 [Candidatus Aminicenantes bacterium]|jgi:hypothetical protein|nr:hypothetical protein [Candidatus Aminicenantes bacterium]
MPEQEQLEIFDENAENLFSNLISFNINPEEVCMGLGIRDVREANLVNVHTYLHLTIPHFLRFADAVNKQVNMLIEKGVISREPEQ